MTRVSSVEDSRCRGLWCPARASVVLCLISATSGLDLPQSGSEDEDEAWPTEGATERIQAANKAMFPQYSKTTPSADPVLLRTQQPANPAEPINTPISAAQCQINGSTIGVPGP